MNRTPVWKYCYYLKARNYNNHSDIQIIEDAVYRITAKETECKYKGMSEEETYESVKTLTDLLFSLVHPKEIVDMTSFKKLQYIT